MNESVIIDAVRSPIGIKNGNMVGIRPDDLTAQVVKELLKRNKNANPNEIENESGGIRSSGAQRLKLLALHLCCFLIPVFVLPN